MTTSSNDENFKVKKPSIIKSTIKGVMSMSVPTLYVAPGALILMSPAAPAVAVGLGLAGMAYGTYAAADNLYAAGRKYFTDRTAFKMENKDEQKAYVQKNRDKWFDHRFSVKRTGFGALGNTAVFASAVALLMTGPALLPALAAVGALGFSMVTGVMNAAVFTGRTVFNNAKIPGPEAAKPKSAGTAKKSVRSAKPAGPEFKTAANQNEAQAKAKKPAAKKAASNNLNKK